jgi:hypothetical protein
VQHIAPSLQGKGTEARNVYEALLTQEGMDLTPVYVQYVRFARRALEKKDRIAILSRGTKAGVGYQVNGAAGAA